MSLQIEHASNERRAVLGSIEPQVEKLLTAHLQSRKLWLPSDLLDEDERADLRARARDLSPSTRASLALNLLTEEGLPHFHRLLSNYLGQDSVWSRWNNIWTAEEDRHGCVLRDYARDSGVFDMRALEQQQYEYIEAGFDPDWGHDPYKLLAYTSLQERATQYAHANLARIAAPVEPRLQKILARVAGDESRHYAFYRDAFALVLEADPERAIAAAWAVMPRMAMPGHQMPGFAALTDVARLAGVYGPADYCRIVSELLSCWGIAAVRGLSSNSERLRQRLLALPERLLRLSDILADRRRSISFEFPFLPDGPVHAKA